MNKFARKLGVAAISLAIATSVVPAASAQTTDIAALLAQIQALQAQLNALQGGSTTTVTSSTFTRDLTVGSKGDDVKALQQFLNAQGYAVATTGVGSAGNETTYFGNATKAALAKFQAAKGISPASGYFGPKTRSFVASMAGTTTPTPTTPTTPAAAPLSVALTSDNPAAANVQRGSANNTVMKFTLTGGSTAVNVTGLTLKSYGTTEATGSTDVSAVKLYDENGVQLGSNRTPAGNQVNFVIVPALTIAANSSRTVSVTADIGSSAVVVAQLRYGIESASAILGGTTFTGSYPLTGNSFTIVPAGQLGTVSTSKFGSVPKTNVKVGEKDVVMERFNVAAGSNEDIAVNQVVFTVGGTVADADLSNLRLRKVGETAVLAGPATISNKKVTFNLASPISLTKGASVNLELVGDVADGGTNARTIAMSVDAGKVIARGATSGTNITSTGSTTATTITIGNETLTVVMGAAHPQGAAGLIIKTTNKKDLAKFDIRANGGDIILNTIKVKMVDTTDALTTSNYVSSVGLYDGDALVSDLKDITAETDQTFSLNWTVPANTTRVLSVKGITNTLTAATTGDAFATTFSEYSGFGLASGATISSTSDVTSTGITIYAAGTSTLSADSVKTPYSQGILAPVNNITLGALKVYAQREDLKLKALTLTVAGTGYDDENDISTVTLYADDGVTVLSNPVTFVNGTDDTTDTFTFAAADFLNDIVFTKNQYKTVLVKGNLASGADGSTAVTMSVAAGADITFTGQDSGTDNTGATTNLYFTSPYAGGTYKFDKTVVEMKKSADSPSGSAARGSYLTYASWDVTNASSDLADVVINQLKLTSKSGLPSGLDDTADETLFKIYDEAGNVIFAGDATKDALVKASGTIYFNGGTSTDYTRGLTVKTGEAKKLVLRIDTTSTAKWPSSQQMQWSIEAEGDVTVKTGTPGNFTADGFVGNGGTTWTIPATTNTVTLP